MAERKRLRFSISLLEEMLDLPEKVEITGVSYTAEAGGYIHFEVKDPTGIVPDGDSVLVYEQTTYGPALVEMEQAPSLSELGVL